MIIEKFNYSDSGRADISSRTKGKDWPVIYLLSNTENLYVGETTSAATRIEQHFQKSEKQKIGFQEIRIVFDDQFNKSVILDYEQRLIKCFKADNQYKVVNRNAGQSSAHDYYQRVEYVNYFSNLWAELQKIGVAKNPLDKLENQNIFKYSPYNALTQEQNSISISIIKDICERLEAGNLNGISLINGCAGTGKTVLATSIINSLVNAINLDESDFTEEDYASEKIKVLLRLKKFLTSSEGWPLKIGFVFPMTGVRGTIKSVFKASGSGLKANMVLSPYDLKNNKYDILFVDESHRLFKRKNLGAQFGNFDKACRMLGFDPETSNQLDWILKQSSYTVLLYDQDQSIKSSDITFDEFHGRINNSGKPLKTYNLTSQMRCAGGDTFISYIKSIVNCTAVHFQQVSNYEFRLFDDVDQMVKEIRKLDEKFGLSRTVAGYSWKWNTQINGRSIADNMDTYNNIVESGYYDIDIDGNHYIWNLTTEGWITREDSKYTIGCIHTTQGLDLNYVGVIFGKEIDYNPVTNSIEVNLRNFYDQNVKAGCSEEVVKQYIINTYTTMLARGIKGCYVYACNSNLQKYLKKYISTYKPENSLLLHTTDKSIIPMEKYTNYYTKTDNINPTKKIAQKFAEFKSTMQDSN